MKLPNGMGPFDRVCGRYAGVLFSLPDEVRGSVYEELCLFVEWAKSDVRGWRFLISAFLPLRYQKKFLNLFCDRNHCTIATKRFFQVLAHYDRLALLPSILLLFEQLRDKAENKRPVYAVLAATLTAEGDEKLKSILRKQWGDGVLLHSQVDSTLVLGGVLLWDG